MSFYVIYSKAVVNNRLRILNKIKSTAVLSYDHCSIGYINVATCTLVPQPFTLFQ